MDSAEPTEPELPGHPLPAFSKLGPATIEAEVDEALAAARRTIEAVRASDGPRSWDHVVVPVELALDRLSRSWAPARHLNAVMSNDELRAVYHNCLEKLSRFHTELGHDTALYEAYTAISEGDEYPHLDTAARKVVDDALRDFRLAGVTLPDAERARFAEIEAELAQLHARFEDHVLDATQAWQKPIVREDDLSGLGDDARAMAAAAAERQGVEGWLLTLEAPLFHAVLTRADDRSLRQELYEAWTTRASDQGPHAGECDNGPVMECILALRQEKAALLGFDHYAELALENRMVERPEDVLTFLHDLAGRALPAARAELDELSTFAAEHYGLDALAPWDIPYFSEKLRQQRFSISDELLKPYFPAPRVIDGLFGIAGDLFGLRFEAVDGVDVWHTDVTYYRVLDRNGSDIGGFYFDLYARPNKRGGAWFADCSSRLRLDGQFQQPVAFLTCNLTPPIDEQPAQFTHDEVLTLFHEFGHGLHHLLTQVDIPSVAGINGVQWDAVELPSQLLENWCWHRAGLDRLAAHVDTGEPLPDATIERLQGSRHFHAALALLRQVEFSLFDFHLHMAQEPLDEAQIRSLLQQVRDQVAVIHPPASNRFAHSFSHIFAGGYAAGYYSYKWAEVLAADAFAAFPTEEPIDAAIGQRFRDAILARGGTRSMRENFREFRGRDPDPEALLRQTGLSG